MQLRVARLCLDCEEIHDQRTCAICGSESFAYISRWIPAPEPRKPPPPPPEKEKEETADVYRQLLDPNQPEAVSGARRWVARGVLGLAAVGLAGWAWRQKPPGATTEAAPERTKKT
jgi:hypothetical protein